MRARYVTLKQLKKSDACDGQVALFKALFGTKVKVTEEICVAVAGAMNFEWAGDYLLTVKQREVFRKEFVNPDWNEVGANATVKSYRELARAGFWAQRHRSKARAFAIAYNSPKK